MLSNQLGSILFITSVAIALSACGGGGSGNNNSGANSNSLVAESSLSISSANSMSAVSVPNPSSVISSSAASLAPSSSAPSSQVSQRLIPVEVNAKLRPDLLLVNPANAQNSMTVETGLQNNRSNFTVFAEDYRTLTETRSPFAEETDIPIGRRSNKRPDQEVYVKAGKIYKVNLQTDSTPIAQQLSNESQAAAECPSNDQPSVNRQAVLRGTSSLDSLSSVFVYDALVNGSCVERAVILSMNATDSPITLNGLKLLASFRNTSSGQLEGFLVAQGTSVGVVSKNLTDFSALTTFSSSARVISKGNRSTLVSVDNAVRRFDHVSKQLSQSIITFPPNSTLVSFHDDNAYYLSGPQLNRSGAATGNLSIYKITDRIDVPLVDLTLRTLFSTEASSMFLAGLTSSKVVFFESTRYRTVGKFGGEPFTLPIPLFTVAYAIRGDRIFYAQVGSSRNTSRFGSMLSDGSGNIDYANSEPIAAYYDVNDSELVENIVLAEYANDRTTLAKANLSLVNARSGEKTALLGTLPDVAYIAKEIGSRAGAVPLCDEAYALDSSRNNICNISRHTNIAKEIGSPFSVFTLCNAHDLESNTNTLCDAYHHTGTAGSLSRLNQYVP